MERQSKESRSLEAYCRGGQGPPRAVAPFGMEWNLVLSTNPRAYVTKYLSEPKTLTKVVEDNKTQAGFDTFFVHDNNTKVTLRVYFGTGGIMTLSNSLDRIWNSSCPRKKKIKNKTCSEWAGCSEYV
jgi:hypothetical protein